MVRGISHAHTHAYSHTRTHACRPNSLLKTRTAAAASTHSHYSPTPPHRTHTPKHRGEVDEGVPIIRSRCRCWAAAVVATVRSASSGLPASLAARCVRVFPRSSSGWENLPSCRFVYVLQTLTHIAGIYEPGESVCVRARVRVYTRECSRAAVSREWFEERARARFRGLYFIGRKVPLKTRSAGASQEHHQREQRSHSHTRA